MCLLGGAIGAAAGEGLDPSPTSLSSLHPDSEQAGKDTLGCGRRKKTAVWRNSWHFGVTQLSPVEGKSWGELRG